MPNPITRLTLAFKAATSTFRMSWGQGWGRYGGGWWSGLWGTGQMDYANAVQDGRGNAIIMACLGWMGRKFPEAPVRLRRVLRDGTKEVIADHPMLALLKKPNDFYTGTLMLTAALGDWMLHGNGYILKERSVANRPLHLWYVPCTTITPYWESPTSFIDYYRYAPGGSEVYELAPADVIHFRNGIDPKNVRCGLSQLGTLFREIFTDDEAANYTAAVLKNLGVLGVLITPDGDTTINPEAAAQIKAGIDARFGGQNRGSTGVIGEKVKVQQLSRPPSEMNLKELRRIPEERVSAIFGLPAIVVGLGAGLDRSCVPSYARVQTPTGTKTIAEIEAGMVVWSFKDGKIVPRMVEHKWATGRDMVYEVRTANRRIRATDNHPFMVRVPGNSTGKNGSRHATYEWRDLRDLKVGDHIIQAKSYPDQGETTLPDGRPATAEMLQFLGAIIGDGTVRPGVGVRLAMPQTDRCVVHYENLATMLFTRQERQSGGSVAIQEATPRAPISLQRRERDFGFSSAQASRELAVLGVSGRAHTKRVPTWVYGLSRPLRLAFLAGIVDTDGYIDARGALTITFCNRALLNDVRDLVISLGIRVSNVGHRRVPASLLPNPGRQDEYEAWLFTASSARQVAEIPFADPLYRERVEANPKGYRTEGFDARAAGLSDDLGFAQIKAIVPIGEDDVFDLTVEDGHSFFCENALISNTFANMSEAREAAVEANLLPTYRAFAETLATQLLPDFEGNPDALEVYFDISEMRELQPDLNKLVEREALKLRSGGITIDEFRSHTGDDPLEQGGDVLLIPATSVVTPLDSLGQPPALPAPAPANPDQQPSTAGYLPDSAEFKALGVLRGIEALRARLQESETAFVGRMLREQRAAVLGAVQGATGSLAMDLSGYEAKAIDPQAIIQRLEQSFREGITTVLHNLHLRAIESTYQVVGSGLDQTIEVDPRIRQRLLRDAAANVTGINHTTLEAVRTVIRASSRADESLDELTTRLRALHVFNDARAETIARTELGIATNRASLAAYGASGIVERVRIHDGTEHDAACASLAGRTVSLAEAQGLPSLGHPRCLVGETEVLAPNLRASFARWFDGEVVILETAEHDVLTCTPNHPILTPEGWIVAGDLQEGDDIVRCLDGERVFRLIDPDGDHRPAMIQDVARALGPARGGTTATVPTTAEDFHGDGADGEVCVVRTNGPGELDRLLGHTAEPVGELAVEGADVAQEAFTPSGLFDHVIPGFRYPTDSGVRSGSIGEPAFRAELGILEPMGFGGCAAQASRAEPFSDKARRGAQDGGDLLGAQLLGDIEVAQHSKAGVLLRSATGAHGESPLAEMASEGGLPDVESGRELMGVLAGLVAPVQVVKVERRQFSGHVYNLETVQHWYIAEHIITHNCVRRFEPLITQRRALSNGHVEGKELTLV